MIRLSKLRNGVMIGLCAVLLAGCGGTDAVQPDQDVTLQPGYGIAAVLFHTADQLNSVGIDSLDHKGSDLSISLVDSGVHLYVFAVPAGTYCLVRFYTGFYRFVQNDPTHGVCFDVLAGKVAYSGTLAPGTYDGAVRTDQNYDWVIFEKMFKDQYPKLANYPIVRP